MIRLHSDDSIVEVNPGKTDVCRLVAIDAGSVARNPGLSTRIIADSSGRKWPKIAGRTDYICKRLHVGYLAKTPARSQSTT